MKRFRLFLVHICLALSSIAFADEGRLRFQLQLQPAIYLGADYDAGIGARLEASYRPFERLCVGASVGYSAFFPTDDWNDRYSAEYRNQLYSSVPIMGYAYWFFLLGRLRPFAGVGVGVAMVEEYYEYYDSYYGWLKVEVEDMYAILEPMVGIEFDLGRRMYLHGSVRYQFIIKESESISGTVGVGIQL